jgi:hypothetical protein
MLCNDMSRFVTRHHKSGRTASLQNVQVLLFPCHLSSGSAETVMNCNYIRNMVDCSPKHVANYIINHTVRPTVFHIT